MIDNQIVYESFFDIDPSYYPVMTEELINEDNEKWKGFYPHDTFLSLLSTVTDVLSRQIKKSLWITGSYGTGKTHAVLTLKRMIEAEESEVEAYFKKNELDDNLLRRFNAIKNGDKKILTVYRYGSSEIKSLFDLTYAIQSSIKKAMIDQGIDVSSTMSLKDDILKTLEDDSIFASFIEEKIQKTYKSLFSPCATVNQLINILKNGSEIEVSEYVSKYHQMVEHEPTINIPQDAESLIKWIEEIIKKNNLRSIFFIWDEFTEFFKINQNNITGFQQIVESTSRIPFIVTIVTHVSHGQLALVDNQKIMDRFAPTIEIKLPDNMAFKLIGKALAIIPDQKMNWDRIKNDLWENVEEAGRNVINSTKSSISEDDFKQILPFHPYAALLLKHLSSLFNSNQRSMFEYIKDGQADFKSNNFKSFIHRNGPYSSTPYLTCDVLWDYFFSDRNASLGKGLENLHHAYLRAADNKSLDEEAKAILKTTLLLQGLSEKAFNTSILRPTQKNLNFAFSGSEINQSLIKHNLEILCLQGILSTRPGKNNETEYLALSGNSDTQTIELLKKDVRNQSAIDILQTSKSFVDSVNISGALKLRYSINRTCTKTMNSVFNSLNTTPPNVIPLIITYAKNNLESAEISAKIQNHIKSGKLLDVIIADVSNTTLSEQEYDEILEALANKKYWDQKADRGQAGLYDQQAQLLVNNWIQKITSGGINVYKDGDINPIQVRGDDELISLLNQINQNRFQKGIESLTTSAPLFDLNHGPNGAILGMDISVKPQGRYISLGDPLKEIWNDALYWRNFPNHQLSQIKLDLDKFIQESFKKDGSIDFWKIWTKVASKPYGFMPCYLSAFILGFLLKEYSTGEYTWSNGSTSELMSPYKMGELIKDVLNPTYDKPKSIKYIVQMSEEEKQFMSHTAIIFDLNSEKCTSLEATRNLISNAIKKLEYPLWTLEYYVKNKNISPSEQIIKIIKGYCNISKNDITDKAQIKELITDIGKLFQNNPGLSKELNKITNTKNTMEGMKLYVSFKYPDLIKYAEQVNDGSYLEAIKAKFSADSPWLWSDADINKEIERVCSEYKAFVVSSSFIGPTHTTFDMMNKWGNKLKNIRIPLDLIISNYSGMESNIRSLISIIRQKSQYSTIDYRDFSTIIETNMDIFESVFSYDEQKIRFSQYCNETFPELGNDSELHDAIYSEIPVDQSSTRLDTFNQLIKNIIQTITCIRLNKDLERKWQEISGVSDPIVWSKNHNFPILLLFEKDVGEARKVFDIILNSSKNEKDLTSAILFLDKPIFAKIGDDTFIHNAFIAKIVKGYAPVIDINTISPLISMLLSEVGDNVYSWVDTIGTVDKVVSKYAGTCYRKSGYQKVYTEIDEMTPDEAKQFLKNLITDDVDVGIAIIRRNNTV